MEDSMLHTEAIAVVKHKRTEKEWDAFPNWMNPYKRHLKEMN